MVRTEIRSESQPRAMTQMTEIAPLRFLCTARPHDVLNLSMKFQYCRFEQLTNQHDTAEGRLVILVIYVYLSSLPVTHLSDAPRRRLVVTGDSARIQDEATENSARFSYVLGVKHRYTGPWFNVSSERQLVIFSCQAADSNPQPAVTRNIVYTSPTLYLLS